MIKIIPTIFSENKKEFNEKFEKVFDLSDKIQIDFMDGKFVSSKSIKLDEVSDLSNYKGKEFEAHIMVLHPEKWIERLKKKGFKKVIFHYEAVDENEIADLINKIKGLKMRAFIALNPETEISKINDFMGVLDGVLFMGVNPGKEGQKFIERIYDKIKNLRKMNKDLDIEVDGGINSGNIRKVFMAGANLINSGSFLSKSDNPKESLKILFKAIKI